MSRPASRQSTAYGSLRPSSRQSVLPTANRQTTSVVEYDASGNPIFATAVQQRMYERQREWEGFVKLMQMTTVFKDKMEEMGEKTELLKEGGKAIATVVENWQNVFRATNIALSQIAGQQAAYAAAGQEDVVAEVPTLVRILIDGQETAQNTQAEDG